jgi:hypothetical protein
MYQLLLAVHSILRWVVLILALIAVARAIAGRRRAWAAADDGVGKWYVIGLDVQTLIGLVLYAFLSPITQAAFADLGAAMKESASRFFAVEHLALAVIALAFAHVGRVRVRRALTDEAKFRAAAVFYTISLLAILVAIPWPFRAAGRPWLPAF